MSLRAFAGSLALAPICALGWTGTAAQKSELVTGARVTAALAAGDVHRYVIGLTAGQFVRISVDPQGIDVGVSLTSPTGVLLAEIGHRSGEARLLTSLASEAGLHTLLVRSLETEPREGRYSVVFSEKRAAVAADERRVRAARRLTEAEQAWSAGESAGDAASALALYEQAFELWAAVRDPAGQAIAARRLGQARLAMAMPEAAVFVLRQSLELSRESRDLETECATLATLALAEVDSGSLNDARTHAQRALDMSIKSGDRRCEAAAHNALGDVDSFTGRTLEAPSRYERALALGRELRDRRVESQAQLNLGYALTDLSRLGQARDAYESALSGWRSVAEKRGEARTLIGLAQLYGIEGEKQEALRRYDQARQLVVSLADRWGQAVVESGMGAAYFQLGEPESSIGHYLTAVELFRSAKVQYGEAANLLHLGASLAAVGRREEALAQERKALEIARSLSDSRLEARALQRIGQIEADIGRLDDALTSQQQALAIAQSVGDVRTESDARNAIGEVMLRSGREDDAHKSFADARDLARRALDRYAESKALFGLSRIESARGHLEDALENVRASLALVEDLRADVASLELRASYMASIRERHELEIDLLTRLHAIRASVGYDARAFEAAERARARSLLDGLAGLRAEIREGVDPSLLGRESAIRQELNAKAGRLARMTSRDRDAPDLKKAIDALVLEYRELRGRVRAESPRYAALTEPRPASLLEVQQSALDEHSMLLQYFIGRQRSYVWVVTPTTITSRVLPGASEIEALVGEYRDWVSQPAGPHARRGDVAATAEAHASVATALSRVLLGPIADQLMARRLVVVPDGVLEALPFAALPDPRHGLAADQPLVPLLQRHEVVHLPSVSTLALTRAARPRAVGWPKQILLFADPVFEADDPRLPATSHRTGQRPGQRNVEAPSSFARLLGSAQEARRIAALTDSAEVLVGARANRSSALDASVERHRVVHFATHAFVDGERPELSSIVLSLYDERGQPSDGFLRLNDVYNMRLPVDLVVLSACSSALGRPVTGEGLIGLVRGFMYAGARRVLASLWKVDDEATSELMVRFYDGLWTHGLTPAAALREAQLGLMSQRRWRHPFYWAGFVISGDWDSN